MPMFLWCKCFAPLQIHLDMQLVNLGLASPFVRRRATSFSGET